MSQQGENISVFIGFIANTFLAVLSITWKELDLIFAVILKAFTTISFICMSIYYIVKTKKLKDNDSKRDTKKD
jgi:hypothetical protein